jgi:hypothetical protein
MPLVKSRRLVGGFAQPGKQTAALSRHQSRSLFGMAVTIETLKFENKIALTW